MQATVRPVCWLVGCLTSQKHTMLYLRDGSGQTIIRAAALRWKLQITLSTSPSLSILTPGQPVPLLLLLSSSLLFCLTQYWDTAHFSGRPGCAVISFCPTRQRGSAHSSRLVGLVVRCLPPERHTWIRSRFPPGDRLVGLVVKASASRAQDPGFESRLRRDFFGVDSYQ